MRFWIAPKSLKLKNSLYIFSIDFDSLIIDYNIHKFHKDSCYDIVPRKSNSSFFFLLRKKRSRQVKRLGYIHLVIIPASFRLRVVFSMIYLVHFGKEMKFFVVSFFQWRLLLEAAKCRSKIAATRTELIIVFCKVVLTIELCFHYWMKIQVSWKNVDWNSLECYKNWLWKLINWFGS